MKSIYLYFIYFLGAAILFSSCAKPVEDYNTTSSKEDIAGVNIIQIARNNPLNITTFPLTDPEIKLPINVGFGALGYPEEDVRIKLTIDQKVLDSINEVRELTGLQPYVLFPADAYTIDKMEVTIPARTLTSDIITFTYNPGKFNPKLNYIMPLSISDASGYKINPNGKTLIITSDELVKKTYNLTEFTTTIEADNYQPGNEVKYAIDGNPSKIWHTPWDLPAKTKFPHWFYMVFGKQIYVTDIAVQPRVDSYNTGFTLYKLEATTDGGKTWNLIKDNVPSNPADKSAQMLDIPDGYYNGFRLTALEGPNVDFTSIGEFWVYGYY